MHTLAERTFDFGDQKRFATLSGDWNPIHVDPVRARRTQAGGVVVHGIHVLLWALDAFASRHPDLDSPPCRATGIPFMWIRSGRAAHRLAVWLSTAFTCCCGRLTPSPPGIRI